MTGCVDFHNYGWGESDFHNIGEGVSDLHNYGSGVSDFHNYGGRVSEFNKVVCVCRFLLFFYVFMLKSIEKSQR